MSCYCWSWCSLHRRTNAGIIWVSAPGDYATFNSNHTPDATDGTPDAILIASGSEVGLIMAARQQLQDQKVLVRVVSMPSWELFDAQPQSYRDQVLLPSIPARPAVEAGASQGWHRYVGDRGDVLGADRFGASAPGDVVMREYGFTVENVCKRTLALLR